jgi:hypothetical protein
MKLTAAEKKEVMSHRQATKPDVTSYVDSLIQASRNEEKVQQDYEKTNPGPTPEQEAASRQRSAFRESVLKYNAEAESNFLPKQLLVEHKDGSLSARLESHESYSSRLTTKHQSLLKSESVVGSHMFNLANGGLDTLASVKSLFSDDYQKTFSEYRLQNAHWAESNSELLTVSKRLNGADEFYRTYKVPAWAIPSDSSTKASPTITAHTQATLAVSKAGETGSYGLSYDAGMFFAALASVVLMLVLLRSYKKCVAFVTQKRMETSTNPVKLLFTQLESLSLAQRIVLAVLMPGVLYFPWKAIFASGSNGVFPGSWWVWPIYFSLVLFLELLIFKKAERNLG